MEIDRTFIALGAVSAFLAVAMGAFGAHGLKERVSPEHLAVFETGARYQMYHALALVLVGLLLPRMPSASTAGWLFVLGTLLFSGSLYGIALTGVRKLGMITPAGGLAFLAGWAALAVASLRSRT